MLVTVCHLTLCVVPQVHRVPLPQHGLGWRRGQGRPAHQASAREWSPHFTYLKTCASTNYRQFESFYRKPNLSIRQPSECNRPKPLSAASCAAPDTPAGAPRHVVVMLMLVLLLLMMMMMLIFHVAGAGAGVSAAAAAGVQEGGAQLGHRGPRHWTVDSR